MKYLKMLSDQNQKAEDSSSYTPYLLSFTAACFYPITWIYCSEQNMSIAENALLRGIACTAVHYITCNLTQSPINIKCPESYKYLVLRSIILSIYSIIFSLSQFVLPLPVVHTINCSGQIFVFIIDYLINGVKINFQQVIGVCVGLTGVLLTGNGKIIMMWIDD